MSILDYFAAGKTPRDCQKEILLEIEDNWDKSDVIAITLPTAAGKSLISHAIMRWVHARHKKKSVYTCPNNLLLEQYQESFPKMHVLRRMEWYQCLKYPEDNCLTIRNKKSHCVKCVDCPYIKAKKKAYAVPYAACNFHSYLSNKLLNHVVIFDEAHSLIQLAQDRASKRIFHSDYDIPSHIDDHAKLDKWLKTVYRTDKKLEILKKEVESDAHKYIIERTYEKRYNRYELCFKLTPLDVSDKCDYLWPRKKVEKIILMSATISKQDIDDLGLKGRRLLLLEADSPIPADRRPIYHTYCGSMSLKNQDEGIPVMAETIRNLLEHETGNKGIIHAPYGFMELLYPYLKDCKRLIWHNKEDKTEMFELFKNSPAPDARVLMASGMYEGIDLAYDAGQFQAIAKVPFPSLAEPAVAYKAAEDPEWYNWATGKLIIQTCGRICRTPTDRGRTYLLDSDAEQWYSKAEEFGLLPKFFKEANIFIGD